MMFRRVSIRTALLMGDMAIITGALFMAGWLRPQLSFGKPLGEQYISLTWMIEALVLLIWVIGFFAFDVYNLQKNLRMIDEIQRLIAAHVATLLAFAGVLYFSFRDISRLQVIIFALISLLLLLAYRVVFRLLLKVFGDKRYGTRRILIVGAGPVGRDAAKMIAEHRWTGLKLIGFVDDDPQANTLEYPHFGPLENTMQVVQQQRISEVIFALPRDAHNKLTNLVAALQSLKVNVRVVPDFFDLVFLRSTVEDFGGMPLVTLREPALDPLQRLVKRVFDLILASIGFMLALPLMAVIAIAIKKDSPGPVIFTQERVGEHGRLFKMYKFRTMVHNAEDRQAEVIKEIEGSPLHKFYDDPRVTRVGHFLRRTSLDELPQFINIIKGDMSLVGPRPELPWLVEWYEPWQRKRFEVPQGLTGWWQVNGRAAKPMHLNTADDLYYIKNYSLWLDIRILWRTIKAVIDRQGSF
jgi:exopolysaccharide biosynthesis polyprenyl glycosylphosphotransferase